MPSDLEIAFKFFETAKRVGFTSELFEKLADRPDLLRAMLRVKTELSKLTGMQDGSQQLAILFATPIHDFEVSVRCENSLRNADIITLSDLVRRTEEQMFARKTIGKQVMGQIVDLLERQSLNFGMTFERTADGGVRVTDWGTPPIRILDRIPDEDEE